MIALDNFLVVLFFIAWFAHLGDSDQWFLHVALLSCLCGLLVLWFGVFIFQWLDSVFALN